MDNMKTASSNLNEDDDAWLYGGGNEDSVDNANQNENTNQSQREDFLEYSDSNLATAAAKSNGNSGDDKTNDEDDEIKNITNKVSTLDTNQLNGGAENGETEKVENEDENHDASDDDDDDDDDDDVNVNIVIDKIAKKTFTNQIATTNAAAVAKPVIPAKGVDLEAQGTINDVPTLEFDLQGIKDDDKPWRKPGADITDYFNYGFNEETWIAYCTKQRRLRAENAANKMNPSLVTVTGGPNIAIQPMITPINISNAPNNIIVNHGMSNQNYMPKSGGYPRQMLSQPPRKMGQIDVIGSTDSTSRRPQYEHEMGMNNHQISVLGGSNNFAPPPNWNIGGGVPPPPVQIRMPHGPMGQRMGHPMQMNFPPYHFGPPGMQQMERPPQNYGYMQQQQYVRNAVPQSSGNQNWEKPPMEPFYPDAGGSPRSRSPTPVESNSKSPTNEKYKDIDQKKYTPRGSVDHSRSGGASGGVDYERGGDHRRSPSPRRTGSSYRSSHRDRDRRDRDRDRDRRDDRQREKSRSRSRGDRSRSRDEKYKRSRRKSDDDDDHRSSRSHKRSKKSRKGRDSNERDNSSSGNLKSGLESGGNNNHSASANDVTNKNDS